MSSDLIDLAQIIERENIDDCVFPDEDVIQDDEESRKKRARKIHRATSLGNLEQQKVHIIFKDSEGLKRVYTTIWAQTMAKVILKNNMTLPVHRIVDLRL